MNRPGNISSAFWTNALLVLAHPSPGHLLPRLEGKTFCGWEVHSSTGVVNDSQLCSGWLLLQALLPHQWRLSPRLWAKEALSGTHSQDPPSLLLPQRQAQGAADESNSTRPNPTHQMPPAFCPPPAPFFNLIYEILFEMIRPEGLESV